MLGYLAINSFQRTVGVQPREAESFSEAFSSGFRVIRDRALERPGNEGAHRSEVRPESELVALGRELG